MAYFHITPKMMAKLEISAQPRNVLVGRVKPTLFAFFNVT